MANQKLTIVCPKCQEEISLDEVITHDLKAKAEIDAKARVEEEKKRLNDEAVMWKQKKEQEFKALLEKKSEQESHELKLLKEENERKSLELKKAQEMELEFRRQKLALEEQKQKLELDVQRKVDEERKNIEQKVAEKMLEEHRFKDAEKEKKMNDMAKMIEDLQMKVQLGSQQLQGEVLELELENVLRTEFPVDDILPVGKGVRGADVKEMVRDRMGRECGTIIWETKRTKNWDEGWITKLKEDMRATKADVAIIVSTALPQGIKTFGLKDGIYVSSFDCFTNLASIIRKGLIEVCHTKQMAVGKNEKIEALYQYITSNEFAQKIDAMMETYNQMKGTLEKEKNAMLKIWAQREKEIDGLKNNTVMIHGSLAGLISEPLPEVASLELDNIAFVQSDDVIVTSGPDTLIATSFSQTTLEEIN